MSDGRVLAITGAVCFVLGVIALAYAVSLGLTAHDFTSAAVCNAGVKNDAAIKDTNCLQRRPIQITDTATGRFGEVNTVDFLDGSNPHESHLGFGRYDTSVLKPGATGIATLWHGQYTNLDVAGIDFLTDENPIAGQAIWILFGVIGIAFALVLWAAAFAWNIMNRQPESAPT